ncbi:MAG: chromosomal replication initiator protein DnaA, partial [Sphingopyxis sp.]|nr:chromosomal replication initiator protein DnaA [Sphingopyxis sp.]
MSDPEGLWAEICVGLRRDLGNRTFDHWLKHVRINGYDAAAGVLSLNAPSAFTGEQISKRFADRILLAWRQHDPLIRELAITAASRHSTAGASVPERAAPVAAPSALSPLVIDARLRFD